MKKSLLLLTVLLLSISQPVLSQSISNSRLEQIKRMGRTTTHITKKYEGTIEKMLFSGHKYGGAFDGVVLRLKNNKLMVFRLLPFLGQSIGPFIHEGQEVEVLASGDKLMLNKVLYKDLAMIDLERDLGRKIQGIGTLKEVYTSTGTYAAKATGKQWFDLETTPMLDIEVKDKIKLADYEGMLVLENDDTLIYQFNGRFKNTLSEKTISYLRTSKVGNGLYYKSPNIYRITSGNMKYSAETAGINMFRAYGFGNRLLRKSEVSSAQLITGTNGFVNGFVAGQKDQQLDTFYFNSKSAAEIEGLIDKPKTGPLKVYYREMPGRNIVRALAFGNSIVRSPPLKVGSGPKEDYHSEKVDYQGVVSKINYSSKGDSKSFESIILDDSVFVKLNEVVMLSVIDVVKEGKPIEISGWRRKTIASEINKNGYTILVPDQVVIDNIKFVNRTSLSTSL